MRWFTWEEVRARRLVRSHLVERAPAARLVEVVREVGGIHAQVMGSAELQLAARVEGITQADVREALWERRELVKAWTLRGTLHLHPAGELALWLAARRAVVGTSDELEAWRDPEGRLHPPLGRADVKAIHAAVWDALDGRCLLREELTEEVVKRVGAEPESRLRSGFAFFLGELCQGPPQGARVTFVRPDQWIEGWQDVEEQHALLEVCRRYVYAYGPATYREFRQWFSSRHFTPADARALFDELEPVEVDVEGRKAFLLEDEEPTSPASSVRLLPEYDVYIMGFREREHLVPEPVKAQVAAYGKGRYEGPAGTPFLVVDGVCA